MRKVRESRNRTDDLLKRKEKELASLRRENLEGEKQLRLEIEQLKAKSQVNSLQQQLSECVLSTENEVKAIEKATAEQLAEMDRSIERIFEDTKSAKKSVQAETEGQVQSLVTQAAACDDRREKIETAKQEDMSRIQATSNGRTEDMTRKTVVELDRIRKRIDAAEDARRHTNEDNEVIFSQYQGQIKTKTETAATSLWNNIETSATIRKQWLESLDAQIIDLMRISRDLDASRLEMSGRREKRAGSGSWRWKLRHKRRIFCRSLSH
jgi:hypothetical protein